MMMGLTALMYQHWMFLAALYYWLNLQLQVLFSHSVLEPSVEVVMDMMVDPLVQMTNFSSLCPASSPSRQLVMPVLVVDTVLLVKMMFSPSTEPLSPP